MRQAFCGFIYGVGFSFILAGLLYGDPEPTMCLFCPARAEQHGPTKNTLGVWTVVDEHTGHIIGQASLPKHEYCLRWYV